MSASYSGETVAPDVLAAFQAAQSDIDPDVQAAWNAAQPGAGEQLLSHAKTIVRGAGDVALSAAEGLGIAANALGRGLGLPLPPAKETAGKQILDAARGMLPATDPAVAATHPLATQLHSALGSSLGFLGAGAALGGGSAVGRVASVAGIGGLSQAGSAYEDALAAGATDEQAVKAGLLNIPSGMTEAITAAPWAGRLFKVLAGAEKVSGRALGHILVEGLEEGAQESFQNAYGEAIAQHIYKPEDADAILQAAQSGFLPAALSGALIGGALHFAERGHEQAAGIPNTTGPVGQQTAPAASLLDEQPGAAEGAVPTPAATSAVAAPGASQGASTEQRVSARERPGDRGDSATFNVPEPTAIELPDERLRAAVQRFASRPEVGFEGTPEIHAASPEIQQRVAQTGAQVALVDFGKEGPVHGYYDPETQTILLNARAGDETMRRSLVDHELVHFARAEYPELYDEFKAAVQAVAPGYLKKQAKDREARQAALRGKKAPAITPDVLEEEAVAEFVQGIPTLLRFAETNPELAVKVATHSPGLFQRLGDMLIDFAYRVGLTKRPSVRALIRDLESTLSRGSMEERLGPQRGVQVALKVAELQRRMVAETPRVQPQASALTRETEAEYPVPPETAGESLQGIGTVPPTGQQVDELRATLKATEGGIAERERASARAAKESDRAFRREAGEQARALETEIAQDDAILLARAKERERAAKLSEKERAAQAKAAERGAKRADIAYRREAGVEADALEREIREDDKLVAARERESQRAAEREAAQAKATAKKADVAFRKEAGAAARELEREIAVDKRQAKRRIEDVVRAKKKAESGSSEPAPQGEKMESAPIEPGPLGRMLKSAIERKEAGETAPKPETPPEGKLSIAQTDSDEFRRWFGESKVVDESGKPLVVYHGTKRGFDTFEAAPSTTGNVTAGLGFYFSADPKEASRYTTDFGPRDGGRVLPTYLSIKNPYMMPFREWNEIAMRPFNASAPDARGAEAYAPERMERIRKADQEAREHVAELKARLIAEGYDGIQVHNGAMREYVAFRPEQIKSATGNRGTFDPSNPDIRFALPVKRRTPDLPPATLESVVQRYGAKNKGQTARTSPFERVREFQAGVRSVREEGVEPQSRLEEHKKAARAVRNDEQGTRDRLVAKVNSRGILEAWEQVALSQLADRAAGRMLTTPTDAAVKEATFLRWVYEDTRRRTAQALGVIRDFTKETQSGISALSSIIAVGTQNTRKKLANLRAKLDAGGLSDEGRLAIQRDMEKLAAEEAATTQKVLRKLRQAGLDPELLSIDYFHDPFVFAKAARIASTVKSNAKDWFLEWRVAAMLGGPQTHVANITGNAAMFAYDQVVARVAESLVNVAARNPDAASIGELPTYMRALLHGVAQAGRNFAIAMRTELPVFELDLMRRGIETAGRSHVDFLDEGRQKIPGTIGRLLRLPSTTTLLAFDEAFKTLAAHGQATALAYREATKEGYTGEARARRIEEMLADPESTELWTKALDTAREVTFQDTHDDKLLRGLLSVRAGLDETFKFPIGSVLLPFVKTPYRIFQRGLGVPFSPFVALKHWADGTWKNKPGAREHDIAEAILGVGLSLALVHAVGGDDDDEDFPLITGSAPKDLGERAVRERVAPPQSIRLPGTSTYYSYARVEPLSVALTTVVDLVRAVRNAKPGEASEAAFVRLFTTVRDQMKDKTFLRTMGDVLELLEEPQSGQAARFTRDTLVTPMVPNIIRAPQNAADEFQRANVVRKYDDASVWQAAARSAAPNALPLMLGRPPLKFDVWGRPAEKPGRSYGARLFSPVPERGDTRDVSALDIAVVRFNDRVASGQIDGDPWFPKPPDYDYTDPVTKKTRHWDDDEYAQLSEDSGRAAASALLADRTLDLANPTEDTMKAFARALSKARKATRERLIQQQRGAPLAATSSR